MNFKQLFTIEDIEQAFAEGRAVEFTCCGPGRNDHVGQFDTIDMARLEGGWISATPSAAHGIMLHLSGAMYRAELFEHETTTMDDEYTPLKTVDALRYALKNTPDRVEFESRSGGWKPTELHTHAYSRKRIDVDSELQMQLDDRRYRLAPAKPVVPEAPESEYITITTTDELRAWALAKPRTLETRVKGEDASKWKLSELSTSANSLREANLSHLLSCRDYRVRTHNATPNLQTESITFNPIPTSN